MNGVQGKAPTWKEWVTLAVFVPPMFLGALAIFGVMIDGIGAGREQRDRCLKNATSGYEISQCH
jgi:hypothetical protein